MGIPDSSLLDLLEKVRSLISWGPSDHSPSSLSESFEMPNNNNRLSMCCECNHATKSTDHQFLNGGYLCQSCGRWFCSRCCNSSKGCESVVSVVCIESNDSISSSDLGELVKSCKFCDGVSVKREGGRKNCEKVHPSEFPRESPEPPSPSFSGDSIQSDQLARYLESRDCGNSPHAAISKSMASLSAHPSPVSVRRSPSRSDEDEAEDSGKHFYSPLSEYCTDVSDVDLSSVSARFEYYNFKSVGSSPLDSPSRIDFSPHRVGHPVQRRQGGSPLSQNYGPFDREKSPVLRRADKGTDDQDNTDDYSDDVSVVRSQFGSCQKPLDFESNGLIWFPPPPEDENDDAESNFFSYDDDEDDIGDSAAMFSSASSFSAMFPSKDKQNEGNKEPLRAVLQGHFRALVSQLLQGENIRISKEDGNEDWLDIVTTIAWQAANFVKPDTSRGGSMDPGDYVKVKCIASGRPSDSKLVKGVVCTKNIKHKRMTTQCKNPRLLLLGGALDYQNVVNQLASFNTLVQQENDHLKMIISKIEALRPNVLLVEKSVSAYAQEYLLSKEISLVLNVKKPLLDRIARCTGALISPSIDNISTTRLDNISTTRLGHCELFRVERVSEEHETVNQFGKKPSKTLMFLEGCPRRLGCTVLLRGACREELKKVKHVVQYAIFAGYHLSLETSFLADEGASLPKMTVRHSIAVPERIAADNVISVVPPANCDEADDSALDDGSTGLKPEDLSLKSLLDLDSCSISSFAPVSMDRNFGNAFSDSCCHDNLESDAGSHSLFDNVEMSTVPPGIKNLSQPDLLDTVSQEERQLREMNASSKFERIDEEEVSSEYFSATDTHQSILVSFSSRCVLKGGVCERSRLLRIKFYGSFDKPLGRYLRDDLFDQTSYCRSCKEPADAHVLCFTHQQGNLTINVRSLSSVKLPGERDGKIWMWHRCLRCAHIDGVPPATRRVVMSDAAWGLSFGKFLELSFSNHATANRVAPCGHSLQRDCLRFYGFGSMVAFFRYSPIDILNVHLPPSVLEFNGHVQQEWIKKEASELLGKMETFYAEISDVLDSMEQKSKCSVSQLSDTNELHHHILELKDQLREERNDYSGVLQLAVMESSQQTHIAVDILELNRLRRDLLIGSHVWDRQLYSLDSLLKTNSFVNAKQMDASYSWLKKLKSDVLYRDSKLDHFHEENISGPQESVGDELQSMQSEIGTSTKPFVSEDPMPPICCHDKEEDVHSDEESSINETFVYESTCRTSNLSDRIDSAWTGTDQLLTKVHTSQADEIEAGPVRQISMSDNSPLKRMMAPVRVHSFDSALRVRERIRKGLPPSSLHLSNLRSFHASGDYRSMVRDPLSTTMRTFSQTLPLEAQKLNLILSSTPSFISSASNMAGGPRLLLPRRGQSDIVVGVYDDDAASIVSYALSCKEYEDWVAVKSIENEENWSTNERPKEDSAASAFPAWQSWGSVDLDYMGYGSYGSEDISSSVGTLFMECKRSPHITISYGDDSSAGGKAKFSVTCYFAKQFDLLRRKCCSNEVDYIRSLSRCKKWTAQGGKSNVYFAKSWDERFIIKQVKKTELESFIEFAPEYFKYMTDSLTSGSPTCLAKILGIYQVAVKHLKGGKETKMDIMVMENLFFKRSISRVYDLKGSHRSRYNPDTTGTDKVLLDMNLVETMLTEPVFLGSKAKRSLERAIWNDTSFLASVDVMDYSLLVGVDKERKELVLGIIDFMRQYTWDKHLETWVKASGILGGLKNASPTIVSPKQYKKRFRKAMTSYFFTVPDQWSS